MDFLTFVLWIVAGGGLYYYFKRKLSYFENRGVPYEPGLPVFGNMASVLLRIKQPTDLVGDIYKAHPEARYVGAFSFDQPFVILRDPELIKAIGIKNFDCFQNHSLSCSREVDKFVSGNLFHLKGAQWRESRNLLSPALTSSKLKFMFKQMAECGANFSRYIARLSDEERGQVRTKDLFTKFTTNVIGTCVFGITVDSLNDPNNQFYVLGKKGAIFQGLTMFKFYMASWLPGLMKLLNVKVIDEDVAGFFRRAVADIVEQRDKEGIRKNDVIQLLMDARRGDAEKSEYLDSDTMAALAFGFFVGGFDTTSTQMCIIAHELAINPAIQRKLQAEIDRVMEETNGELTYEAIQGTTYFDAVFSESLRRHTEAVILDRECEKPFELPAAMPGGKPFVVQPGMKVWVSGRSIHMDPKYYENPEKFDPERYYQKKLSMNDEFNLGFGIGPRACIGYRFAILETKVLFFYLLSEFSFVANERTNVHAKSEVAGEFCLAIERRNKIEIVSAAADDA